MAYFRTYQAFGPVTNQTGMLLVNAGVPYLEMKCAEQAPLQYVNIYEDNTVSYLDLSQFKGGGAKRTRELYAKQTGLLLLNHAPPEYT